jgi:hypothetical protein
MVSTLLQVRSEVSASMFQTLTHVKPSLKWLASLPMRFNILMDSYIDYPKCLQNTNISGKEEWKDQVQNVEMNIGGFNEIKETSVSIDMAQAKKEYEDSLFNLYDGMKDEDNVCQIDISQNFETTHTENDLYDMYESMENDHMMEQKSNQNNDGVNISHSAQNEMIQSDKGQHHFNRRVASASEASTSTEEENERDPNYADQAKTIEESNEFLNQTAIIKTFISKPTRNTSPNTHGDKSESRVPTLRDYQNITNEEIKRESKLRHNATLNQEAGIGTPKMDIQKEYSISCEDTGSSIISRLTEGSTQPSQVAVFKSQQAILRKVVISQHECQSMLIKLGNHIRYLQHSPEIALQDKANQWREFGTCHRAMDAGLTSQEVCEYVSANCKIMGGKPVGTEESEQAWLDQAYPCMEDINEQEDCNTDHDSLSEFSESGNNHTENWDALADGSFAINTYNDSYTESDSEPEEDSEESEDDYSPECGTNYVQPLREHKIHSPNFPNTKAQTRSNIEGPEAYPQILNALHRLSPEANANEQSNVKEVDPKHESSQKPPESAVNYEQPSWQESMIEEKPKLFESILHVVEQTQDESTAFKMVLEWYKTLTNEELLATYEMLLIKRYRAQQKEKVGKEKVQPDIPPFMRDILSNYTSQEVQTFKDIMACNEKQEALKQWAAGDQVRKIKQEEPWQVVPSQHKSARKAPAHMRD